MIFFFFALFLNLKFLLIFLIQGQPHRKGIPMKDVMDEITILPGVLGACLFNKKYGQLCPGLPSSFARDTVESIFNRVTRLFDMGDIVEMDFQTLTLWYDAFVLMATFVEKETFLLTICQSRANLSLVSTTISMMSRELKKELSMVFSDEHPRDEFAPASVISNYSGANEIQNNSPKMVYRGTQY